MKLMLMAVLAAAAPGAFADPSVTIRSATRDAASGAVAVAYDLAGEDAIVTLAADVYADGSWRALPTRAVKCVAGDVNRLVAAGENRSIVWRPSLGGADMEGDGKIRVRVTLWSLAQPPDYMSVRIMDNKDVRYYVDADALPHPPSAANWKLYEMLFRKIPAQGVKWKMASVSGSRIVRLNHDYYFAVYPYTRGHQRNVWYDMEWGVSTGIFADPSRMHESPCPPFSYTNLRGADTGAADYPLASDSLLSAHLNAAIAVACDLPTEAEWEYACRAGTWTPLYTGKAATAENIDEVAWYGDNADNKLHPVGEKAPNAWGIYDLYGNIHEWCRDFYAEANDPYFASTSFDAPADDPVGPAENKVLTNGARTRVLRGGCHYTGASGIHSGFRWGYAIDHSDDKAFGFRPSHTITGTPFANPTGRYEDLDTSVADANWDCTGHLNPGLIVATAELDDVDLRGTVPTPSAGVDFDFDSEWFARAHSDKCRWNGGVCILVR